METRRFLFSGENLIEILLVIIYDSKKKKKTRKQYIFVLL